MGDLCSISSGESDTQDAVADGPFAFFDRSRSIKRSSRFLYDCEALIIPGEGKEFLPRHFKGKFDLHQRAYALFDFRPELDVRFLYHLLHYKSDYFPSVAVGATVKSLRRRHFDDLPVPVPPLPEQRRIVTLLDEAFEKLATVRANTEGNLQNARGLFESLLNAAIQGGLNTRDARDHSAADVLHQIAQVRSAAILQGKAKAEKTEKLVAGGPLELPASWTWSKLESLTLNISDGVHKKPRYVRDGIPFVTVKNLTAGPGISFDELNYISERDHGEFIKRTHPEPGDLLITKDGTIGVVRLIDTDVEFSIFVSVALIKPATRELGPYLAYALRAQCVQGQIVPQGAALKHLYLVDLRRLAIPIPPLAEQGRIVALLAALEGETQRLGELYERKIAEVEALKKSILHEAFSGRLH